MIWRPGLKLASPKGPILRYADYALHLADSTRYPNCVFEVAHSQGYDDVLKRATEYLRGSRGAISAVIIINFERPLTLSKISTIEVRRWIKRGSRHPGTPSHDHENEAEAAKVRSSMPPGAVWASYRDGPRYKIFAEEDVHQAKFLRLLHQDLFGKETSTPMAEVEVDLNLLRQSIDIQLQKHREQKDYADYYEEDIVETIDEVSDDTS